MIFVYFIRSPTFQTSAYGMRFTAMHMDYFNVGLRNLPYCYTDGLFNVGLRNVLYNYAWIISNVGHEMCLLQWTWQRPAHPFYIISNILTAPMSYFRPLIFFMLHFFNLLKRTARSVFAFLLLFSFSSNAQELKVNLKVVNKKNEAVPFASFNVIKRTDTLQSFQKTADSSGQVSFNLEKDVQYIVKISSVDYLPLEKGITVSQSHLSFSFTAEAGSKSLKGVTVNAKKPLMKQEDDKTIVDPEPIAATSTNAYEIIEKTPGVFVDQDGNVYLNGTTPASIYINGKEMKMSATDIATMLKSLPPNSIEKIEIMRTPSAKYDASGGGGIVNIVLKKGVKLGLTGSVNAGISQGKYSNQFAGLTINNNTDKKHSYLNLNFNNRNSFERIKTDRFFSGDSLLSQDANTKYPGHSFYLGYGLGYEFNKKWEVSYDGRANLNFTDNKTDNISIIKNVNDGSVKTNNLTNVENNGKSVFLMQELGSTYKIDTSGSEWTTGLSFVYGHNNNDQDFVTTFFSLASPPAIGGGEIMTNRTNGTIASDLKRKLKKQFTIETGVKSSLLQFSSNTDYFTQNGSSQQKDNLRTNRFRYSENINAIYLQGSKTIKTFIVKLGARLENTNMNGHQVIPFDTTFKIHGTDLFPYVYLSKKVMTIAGYDLRAYLVYRRTISRPVYDYLNPFPRYVDRYLTEIGNPRLRPQFTENYEANISVDERPLLAVGRNYTKDIFTNVIYQADSNHTVSYRTYDNLGTNKEYYFRALGAIPPGKKYFFVVVAQYSHNFYQGLYDNKPLAFKKGTWTFYTFHSLKLDKRSQVTLNGFVRLKGQQQFYELSSFGSLNASINRQFLEQKLTVTLSANDMFYTNQNDFTINQGSVKASGSRKADTRRFGINFRYNFGIRKKEENNNNPSFDESERSN
jgi:iron complex outermembrane receptor protein